MCICAEGFGGPDCGTKLDGGQLVWETLMDSRLSAVSRGCHCMEVPCCPPPGWFSPPLHPWDHPSAPTPSLTPRVPHLHPQDTASRFLHRLGHTMVEGPEATLWMFGGLGLPQGLLGNLYR